MYIKTIDKDYMNFYNSKDYEEEYLTNTFQIMQNFLRKYNWVILALCAIIWLIQYVNEPTLWYLSGVFVFSILSVLSFKQKNI